jgi:hypothetical protein
MLPYRRYKTQFPLIGENLLNGVVTMRTLLILAAIIGFSVSALAQTAAPKHSGKPLKQAKPTAPMACKLVGTVKRWRQCFLHARWKT